MKKIIIVGNFQEKSDGLIELFTSFKKVNQAQLYFLDAGQDEKLRTVGKIIQTSDYHSSRSLLESIQPKSVVFFSIDNFLEVALRVTCSELSIPVLLLEHGLRYYDIAYERLDFLENKQSRLTKKIREIRSWFPEINILFGKKFTKNSYKQFTKKNKKKFQTYLSFRKQVICCNNRRMIRLVLVNVFPTL